MKHIPDDTIYRLKHSGTRVRIVGIKESPYAGSQKTDFITVAQVKDGHRWLAKPDEILTEKEWLASRKA